VDEALTGELHAGEKHDVAGGDPDHSGLVDTSALGAENGIGTRRRPEHEVVIFLESLRAKGVAASLGYHHCYLTVTWILKPEFGCRERLQAEG
jgi:hypothetical protein